MGSIFIGKKTKEEDIQRCNSLFRLIGKNEDALSYTLGYLLFEEQKFCVEILKEAKVLERRRGKSYRKEFLDYDVYLQQLSSRKYGGRRDIVIETKGKNRLRVIIEAKIGKGIPNKEQLLKYTVGTSNNRKNRKKLVEDWKEYERKAIVILSRDKVRDDFIKEIKNILNKEIHSELKGIELFELRWHQVFEKVLNYVPKVHSNRIKTFLFDQFIEFFKEDYEMKYYDAEILIQDINKENAYIFFDGYMYVRDKAGKDAPLYFAPYLTESNEVNGLQYISKVEDVKTDEIKPELIEIYKESYFTSKDEEKRNLWNKYWEKGLFLIIERAKKEGWKDPKKLYFLSPPIKVFEKPIKKCKYFKMIPKNYSLSFFNLFNISKHKDKCIGRKYK